MEGINLLKIYLDHELFLNLPVNRHLILRIIWWLVLTILKYKVISIIDYIILCSQNDNFDQIYNLKIDISNSSISCVVI